MSFCTYFLFHPRAVGWINGLYFLYYQQWAVKPVVGTEHAKPWHHPLVALPFLNTSIHLPPIPQRYMILSHMREQNKDQWGHSLRWYLKNLSAPLFQGLAQRSRWIPPICFTCNKEWIIVYLFALGCSSSLMRANLDLPSAAPKKTLLIGVVMAPPSCQRGLFLLWWRPGRISSEAFEARAVESQTALLHRAYTTSSQAVVSHMSPSIAPLWWDWNNVTCSPLNLFFISF